MLFKKEEKKKQKINVFLKETKSIHLNVDYCCIISLTLQIILF